MAEKQIVCDSCGEKWEKSFFCETCSNGGSYEMREVPNIMWDGLPSEEYVWEEEWVSNGDICLNCCMGHTNLTKREAEGEDSFAETELSNDELDTDYQLWSNM